MNFIFNHFSPGKAFHKMTGKKSLEKNVKVKLGLLEAKVDQNKLLLFMIFYILLLFAGW